VYGDYKSHSGATELELDIRRAQLAQNTTKARHDGYRNRYTDLKD